MEGGYIKLFRSSQKNEFYFAEPFTKWQAWQDLILLANYKDSTKKVRGISMTVKRGEVAWSTRALAERWQWSRDKIKRFLKHLEDAHKISPQKSQLSNRYLIVNYDKYQGNESINESTDKSTDKSKDKKVKKVKNKTLVSDLEKSFEIFWTAYPRKDDKRRAFDKYQTAVDRSSVEEILTGAKTYALEKRGSEKRFIKLATTWLNGDCWKNESASVDQFADPVWFAANWKKHKPDRRAADTEVDGRYWRRNEYSEWVPVRTAIR